MFRSLRFVSAGLLLLAASTAQALSDLSPQLQQDMLDAHNAWRAELGIEPLRWADDLAAGAQQWANYLAAARGCEMEHSRSESRQKTGENLYWASPIRWTSGRVELQTVAAAEVLKSWGSEREDYDATNNVCAPGKQCGHYTQVMWRNTRDLGCAMQQCQDKSQVWVCRYRPAGNWIGQRPY